MADQPGAAPDSDASLPPEAQQPDAQQPDAPPGNCADSATEPATAAARAGRPAPASAAVFDLDGVLADVRHRLHHVVSRPKRWNAFFAAAPHDPPLVEGLAAVAEAEEQGLVIVYLTGRPERCRDDTLTWLAAHGLPEGELFMRDDADRRPARLTKVAHLRRLARRMCVAVLVDDDAAVVDAVRAAGFHVLHATWMNGEVSPSTSDSASRRGNAQDVLFAAQEADGRT